MSGWKTTLVTCGNWRAVFSIDLLRISIRADPPVVNHGTSLNVRVSVP